MIDWEAWQNEFLRMLDNTFGDRVWFVGLQGSYGRAEATESSDLDVVVILDAVGATDIQQYRRMLDALPHRELICGFFSGKKELLNWDPADLFQFYYDTKPIRGSLDLILPLIDTNAVRRAIRTGACNIYHGCVHNMLHGRSEEALRALYKSASFVLQAIAFDRKGQYFSRQAELRKALSPMDQNIADTFLHLRKGDAVDFDKAAQDLFAWAQAWITNL